MMRTWISVVVCVLLALPLNAAAYPPAEYDPQYSLFTEALGQAGLDTAVLTLDTHDRSFYGGDCYRLPFFDALMEQPLKISPFTRRITDDLLANSGDLSWVTTAVQQRLNSGVRISLIGDPLAEYHARVAEVGDDCLAVALSELDGMPLEWHLGAAADDTPLEVRQAAALLLFVISDALEYRDAAFEPALRSIGMPPDVVYYETLRTANDWNVDEITGLELLEQQNLTERLLDRVDWDYLNTGATLLAAAVDAVTQELVQAEVAQGEFWYRADTPLGIVALGGSGADTYDGAAYLLLIDTGGADHYLNAGANQDFYRPISVAIDLAGDDVYIAEGLKHDDESLAAGHPSFGAGSFGYGILCDAAGNDSYTGGALSQGAGLFGVGILCDGAGDDTYDGVLRVQGSGTYGTGMLIDRAGDDSYHGYQYAQGFGYTRGVGLLLDVAGDDSYQADDEDILFGSPQSAEHNANLCQGFGYGLRGDYTNGHSWAGGVGMLVDGAGDDAYSCGVFGQGGGYWYGTGILADKAGDDSYHGMWYAMGSCAHFALGILQDDAGDDSYVGEMNMCVGAGHDFSLGWLEDRMGNDTYDCPNLSLGAGNANGIGVFWDAAGNDAYLSQGTTLGGASGINRSIREFILTLGLFVDGGGSDSYLESGAPDAERINHEFAGDGQAWQRAGANELPSEIGVGIDGD